MRILSKFHDYYDSVAWSNYPVYERKNETYTLNPSQPVENLVRDDIEYLTEMCVKLPRNKSIMPGRLKYLVVGFCGEIFPAYVIYDGPKPYACIDYQDLVENYKKIYDEDINISRSWKLFNPERFLNQDTIDQWKAQYNNKKSYEIFIKLGYPLFSLTKSDYLTVKFEKNINLSDIRFQRIVHPFQAHQRIEQFLSNDLAVTQEKSPDFGDVMKRDAHGFDNWSFKQVGPKPRKRKS